MLRGGVAPDHELCGGEDRRAAGPGHTVPHARSPGAPAKPDDQCPGLTGRGHLAEFGVVAPQGPVHVERLASALDVPDLDLPETVRELAGLLLKPDRRDRREDRWSREGNPSSCPAG